MLVKSHAKVLKREKSVRVKPRGNFNEGCLPSRSDYRDNNAIEGFLGFVVALGVSPTLYGG